MFVGGQTEEKQRLLGNQISEVEQRLSLENSYICVGSKSDLGSGLPVEKGSEQPALYTKPRGVFV